MTQFDRQRRAAMLRLLSAASMLTALPQALTDPELWERLSASIDKPSSMDTAALEHFETLASTCWEFCNAGQFQVAEQVLPGFLLNLLELAPYHPKVAKIAAQSLKLQSIVIAHRLKLDYKVTLCEQAVAYARQSNDYITLVTSLIELTVAYRYTRQYENVLRAAQEALYYSHKASPLLQSHTYIVMAEALSRCGRGRETSSYIQLAYETFPNYPEHDPLLHAILAGPNVLTMSLYEGLTYINICDGKRAIDVFDGKLFGGRLNTYRSANTLPDRIRLEILNHQGQAAILSNDLEEYAHYLEEGIVGAVILKSQKRLDEALTTFRQEMPPAWRNERQIKDIVERFHLVV